MFVGVHVGAILLDTYTDFGITDVLVPFTGSWHPAAVAWGIVGMYLLVAIEITSLLRHRMSKRAWHAVHLLSYFLFATTTVHMLTAGTDVKALVASTAAVLLGVAAVFGSVALYVWRNQRHPASPATWLPARAGFVGRFDRRAPGSLARQRAGAVPDRRPVRPLRRAPEPPPGRLGGSVGRSRTPRRRRRDGAERRPRTTARQPSIPRPRRPASRW